MALLVLVVIGYYKVNMLLQVDLLDSLVMQQQQIILALHRIQKVVVLVAMEQIALLMQVLPLVVVLVSVHAYT